MVLFSQANAVWQPGRLLLHAHLCGNLNKLKLGWKTQTGNINFKTFGELDVI